MNRQVTDLERYRRDRERKRREQQKRLARFRQADERARGAATGGPSSRRAPGRPWLHGMRWWVVILAALFVLNVIRLLGPAGGR